MRINVTKDNVTILEDSNTPHENEYKITTCYFTFDEFIDSFQVKRAIFTILSTNEMYETDILDYECDIPSEVLKHEYETIKLGVYGYNIGENEELVNRFSPSYDTFVVPTGSYQEGALSPEPITPTQYDLYSAKLQEGLDKVDEALGDVDDKIDEVDDKLDEMDDKITETDQAIERTNNLDLDVSKEGKVATVTLTKKDASTKVVTLSDGTSLMFNWDGTRLGVKTDEDSDYTYVDLQGIQGPKGDTGAPFRIKKTYPSVEAMNSDFNNMEYGDYVMIASEVETPDNAKLYTRGEYAWIFISDFSGATGIQGPTGLTPNIQIGTVTSGDSPSVTRSGTDENPVLNFVLQKGDTGETGATGATGATGNGIDHISLTSTEGATKTYTIYYTNGTTTTFDVTDGEITEEVFEESQSQQDIEIDKANAIYNILPKVSGEGITISLDNTGDIPFYNEEIKGNTSQETTTGANLQKYTVRTFTGYGNNYVCDETGQVTLTNTSSTNVNNLAYNLVASDSMTLEAGTYTLKLIGTIDSNTSVKVLGEVITLDSNQEYQFTLSEQTTEFYVSFRISPGTHNSNFYITLASGTTPTTERYTYGASPNPNYPQDIHVVSGVNNVTVCGKNQFNKADYKSVRGYFNTSGNLPISSSNANLIVYVSCKPNTTYTASKIASKKLGIGYTTVIPDVGVMVYNAVHNDTGTSATTTTGVDAKYLVVYIRNGNMSGEATLQDIVDSLQIEIGSTASTYEAYTGTTYPINLPVENLYDKDTVICKDNYVITAEGEEAPSTSGLGYTSTYIPVKPNTQYTLSGIIGTGGYSGRYYYDSSKNFLRRVTALSIPGPSTFTTDSETYYMQIQYSVAQFQSDTVMLCEGTSSTYNPYGNPKMEICKIGDYEDKFIKPSGKNLVNVSSSNEVIYSSSYNKFTLDNGVITTSGNTQVGFKVKVKPNTTYTQSALFTGTSGTNELRIREYTKEPGNGWATGLVKQTAKSDLVSGSVNSQTITTTNYTQWLLVIVYSTGSGNVYSNMQLELGSSNTSYELYNNGKWYLQKNIGKRVLDGTGQITIDPLPTGMQYYSFNVSNSTTVPSSVCVCDKLSYSETSIYSHDIQGIKPTSAGAFKIKIFDSSLTTVALFRTWLENNNLTVYFQLATPTYIELIDSLQRELDDIYNAHSYKGQTNITQENNDLPFNLKAVAIRDLSTIFDNQS